MIGILEGGGFAERAGRRNYMELVKLLYFADRAALVQLQSQITGDRLMAMPYGPVLSRILNLIRGGPIDEGDVPWFDAVSPLERYDVKALKTPGDDELSGAQCLVIEATFNQYGKMTWQELSRVSHSLPEWSDPNGGAIHIAPEQVLSFEGVSAEAIQHIKDELATFERLDEELKAYEGQECEVEERSLHYG
jgi:uncharacterized phage-associated protein